jgi:hypothetical protein
MNIFLNTAVYYFQVPQFVMESPIWRELKPVSQSLYIYLLFVAQRNTSPFVTLTAGELRDNVGLSARSVSTARKELNDKNLVRNRDKHKDGFEYEIVDPSTGRMLGKIQDFNQLSPELLEAYFMHHLSAYSPQRTDDGMRFTCPFHAGAEGKSDQMLSAKLSDGGPWSCGGFKGCKKKGKLVAFEIAMAAKDGKTITATEAHHRVQMILVRAANQKAHNEAVELAEARAVLGVTTAYEWGDSETA